MSNQTKQKKLQLEKSLKTFSKLTWNEWIILSLMAVYGSYDEKSSIKEEFSERVGGALTNFCS